MLRKLQYYIVPLILLFIASPAAAQKQEEESCFTAEARAQAEQTAKVWQEPDPDYDPVLGYSTGKGARVGAPTVNEAGLAAPITCTANRDPTPGAGTTP